MSASTSTSNTGYLSGIEPLTGTNFSTWRDQVKLTLGVMDLDHALRTDPPAALTDASKSDQKRAYEQWERSNRMSLMIIKNSISVAIRGAIPDSENAKEYLSSVEEQFKGTSKAHASTLILKMLTTKYDGVSCNTRTFRGMLHYTFHHYCRERLLYETFFNELRSGNSFNKA
jgi:hypothetical protein